MTESKHSVDIEPLKAAIEGADAVRVKDYARTLRETDPAAVLGALCEGIEGHWIQSTTHKTCRMEALSIVDNNLLRPRTDVPTACRALALCMSGTTFMESDEIAGLFLTTLRRPTAMKHLGPTEFMKHTMLAVKAASSLDHSEAIGALALETLADPATTFTKPEQFQYARQLAKDLPWNSSKTHGDSSKQRALDLVVFHVRTDTKAEIPLADKVEGLQAAIRDMDVTRKVKAAETMLAALLKRHGGQAPAQPGAQTNAQFLLGAEAKAVPVAQVVSLSQRRKPPAPPR
jgi:hypothetical protein